MTQEHITNRLRRVSGQLQRLEERVAAGEDCTLIIPQFLAIKGAVAGAFEEYVKDMLDRCPAGDEVKMKQLVRLLTRQ